MTSFGFFIRTEEISISSNFFVLTSILHSLIISVSSLQSFLSSSFFRLFNLQSFQSFQPSVFSVSSYFNFQHIQYLVFSVFGLFSFQSFLFSVVSVSSLFILQSFQPSVFSVIALFRFQSLVFSIFQIFQNYMSHFICHLYHMISTLYYLEEKIKPKKVYLLKFLQTNFIRVIKVLLFTYWRNLEFKKWFLLLFF